MTSQNAELQNFAADFWQWRAAHQPVTSDDLLRIERPDNWQPDWSAEAVRKQRTALSKFENRWRQMNSDEWSVSQQVDYRLLSSAMARVRWELDVLRWWQRSPMFYVYQTMGTLFELLLINRPFDEKRGSEIIRCLQSFPQILESGRQNLATDAVKSFAIAALEKLRDCRQRMQITIRELRPHLTAGSAEKIVSVSEAAIAALESFAQWIEKQMPQMSDDFAVGREAYLFFLQNVALMPYTPEELLAMGQQEWERSLAFEAIATERTAGIAPAPLFASLKAQIAKEAEDEIRIREFLERKNILTVPAWMQHYRNLPIPAYLQPLASLGVCDDLTSLTRLNEDGVRYTPEPASDLGYFELSAARDPRPLLVHEGVPGHYFQMTLSWAHENPIRRYYYDSGPNEGIGFYSEEMMLQAGLFDDNPHTRQVIYNYMRLRALRVEIDVKLALGLFTMDQATQYLQTRVPMDYETARFEAVFFSTNPGQAITYQIGKLQIVSFLAEARQVLGEKFNLRQFHDYLWKNGNVPISLLRWEYPGLHDELTASAI
jgi:uncharacterized protein (DUF885 family)